MLGIGSDFYFLHHADSTHRSTAPTTDGKDLERFERMLREHLVDGHTHDPIGNEEDQNTLASEVEVAESSTGSPTAAMPRHAPPTKLAQYRWIVDHSTFAHVLHDGQAIPVDLFSAGAILAIYDALTSDENRAKLLAMHPLQAATIAFKLANK